MPAPLVWLFLVGLLADAIRAQDRPAPVAISDISVRFRHLTVADGLSQTTIYAIHQDQQGFMWFATQDGLNRYDGHSMTVFRRVPFDSTALGDNTVSAIAEDHLGNLWVGTGRGAYRMDAVTGGFTAFRNDPADEGSLGDDFVRSILEDRHGSVWIATRSGLDRFDSDTNRFTHYRHDEADSSSLDHNQVSWLYEDLSGHLWAVTAAGLNRLREDGSGFDHFLGRKTPQTELSLTDYRIQRLVERPEEPGVFWIGTTQGLLRFDTSNSDVRAVLPASGESPFRVADLTQDPIARQVLWLAIPGMGLGRLDIRSGRFSVHGPDPTDSQSLSTSNTERVYVDRSGILWVGVNGVGVDRFNPATVGMSHFRHQPGNPRSLPGQHVRGLHQGEDGALWVGTRDRGGASRISRFDPGSRTFRHFEHDPDDPQSLSDGRIRDILVDREGAVWVGVGSLGLDVLQPGNGSRFEHVRHVESDPASLSHNTVRYLLEDEDGTIWVGTNGGLNRLVSKNPVSFHHYFHDPADESTLSDDRISALFESRAGFIWVGVDGGLNRLDPVTGSVERYLHDEADAKSVASDAVLAIHERTREPGVIWVGTFGGGLNRLDQSSGTFDHYTERDGLPNNTVYGILEDEQGRLWLSTNVGLSRFEPETGMFRNYGLDVGLQSLEFNSVAYHEGPFGEMFFGGVNGFNAFFPDELTDNLHPPEVVITDVHVAHRHVPNLPRISSLMSTSAPPEIYLGPSQADVTIDFVALHFQNPSRNTYAYRLEGYDDDWVDSETKRSATYTNLEPGQYVFRVKAANGDGIWNEEGVALGITVKPPWWRTWWALLIYAVLFVAGAAGFHRIQKDRLLHIEREKAQQREIEHGKKIKEAYDHLKATQEQLIQSEKMASLGQLTAGIAHEIKNPLNFVNNFNDLTRAALEELQTLLEAHRSEIPAPLAQECDQLIATVLSNTDRVRQHGQRADAVVKNMLRHSLSSKSERHPTDVNALLDEFSRLVQRSFEAQHPDLVVEIETRYDRSIVRADVVPQDLSRVFINILNNAFEALLRRRRSGDASFAPKVVLTTKGYADRVEIIIADNGGGVAEAIRDRIFNPFFTTKEVGEGAGLGLSMSYEIVAAHGGALKMTSEGEGATFVIRLPI